MRNIYLPLTSFSPSLLCPRECDMKQKAVSLFEFSSFPPFIRASGFVVPHLTGWNFLNRSGMSGGNTGGWYFQCSGGLLCTLRRVFAYLECCWSSQDENWSSYALCGEYLWIETAKCLEVSLFLQPQDRTISIKTYELSVLPLMHD